MPAVELHGNLSQNARERNLEAFTSGGVQVLVATDIAARGIHVDDIELVVHVDPPSEHKAYLHRSGRTARAGAGGTVVTLMLPEQRGDVRTLARLAGISPTTTKVTPGSEHILALTGPPAPYVTPAPEAPAAARGSSRSSSRGTRSGGSSSAARPAAWSGSRGRGRRGLARIHRRWSVPASRRDGPVADG